MTEEKYAVPPEFKTLVDSVVPEGLSLRPFQYSGVKFLVERVRGLLASDPGTGKTVMLITAVNYVDRYTDNRLCSPKVLVLCPKSMLLTWQREIKKWAVGTIEWTVKNWDQLISEKKLKALASQGWDVIIADESHQAIKNPKAIRCRRFLDTLIPKAKRVWLSTATPASKSGLDYFCTLKVCLPKLFGSMKEFHFMTEFCNKVPDRWARSGYKYEGFRNTAVLKELFTKCALRHKKAEVLPDLPEKQYSDIEVEVDESIVADHLELDINLVIDKIEKGEPLPGHIAHVMQATAHAKIADVMELVENFPAQEALVVFAWHRSVVHAIEKEMKDRDIECAVITGEINSAEERQKIVDSFQSGKLKRLVLNMQSGGVGLTLTAAATAIYVEFPHSPIHLIQSENRIHRIGSVADKVHILRVIGKNTVDEAIFNALDRRCAAINKVGV